MKHNCGQMPSVKDRSFRPLTHDEMAIVRKYFAALINSTPESEDTTDYIGSANFAALNYIPDGPGHVGTMIFASYGAGMEYYQVFEIDRGSLQILKQAPELEK